MAISLKNCRVEQKLHSFLTRCHDVSLNCDHLLILLNILSVHLRIPVSLPQFHYGRPRMLLYSVTPLHYACCISLYGSPRHDFRRRSLLILVPAHSDTHHLNRHIGWCGCHEILIPRYLTVPFLSNFFDLLSTAYEFPLFCFWKVHSGRC